MAKITLPNDIVIQGQRADDQPRGVLKWQDGVYEGIFVNGIPHGACKKTLPDGTVTTGEFKNGFPHGLCTEIRPDGLMLQGNFTNGYLNGRGMIKFASGTVHRGEFVNNRLYGQGEIVMKNMIRSGSFVNDCLSGDGTVFINYEIKYQGESLTNLPNDNGKVFKYSGEFKNGLPHGIGESIHNNGTKIAGQFVNGRPYGICKVFRNNVYVYHGGIKAGKLSGYGQAISDRFVCSGQFIDGKISGKVQLVLRDYCYQNGKITRQDGESTRLSGIIEQIENGFHIALEDGSFIKAENKELLYQNSLGDVSNIKYDSDIDTICKCIWSKW